MYRFKDEYDALPSLAEGNLSAFNFLYRKYYRAVYMNISKFVKDEAFAEDLLQEVFIALWENRTQIRIDMPAAGWLFTVSYNKSFDFLKRQLKEFEILQDTEKPGTGVYYDLSESEVIYQERLAILKEAINTLPAKKKEIFMLCRFENKKPEEVSEELGLTVISVKDYLKQSTKLIKQYVQTKYVVEASVLFFLFLKILYI